MNEHHEHECEHDRPEAFEEALEEADKALRIASVTTAQRLEEELVGDLWRNLRRGQVDRVSGVEIRLKKKPGVRYGRTKLGRYGIHVVLESGATPSIEAFLRHWEWYATGPGSND